MFWLEWIILVGDLRRLGRLCWAPTTKCPQQDQNILVLAATTTTILLRWPHTIIILTTIPWICMFLRDFRTTGNSEELNPSGSYSVDYSVWVCSTRSESVGKLNLFNKQRTYTCKLNDCNLNMNNIVSIPDDYVNFGANLSTRKRKCEKWRCWFLCENFCEI